MGTKEYRYEHKLGKQEALKRAGPFVDGLARKYMMKREDLPDGFKLNGKGVDARVTIAEDHVIVSVEMSFLIEKIARSTIEQELNYKVPKALS